MKTALNWVCGEPYLQIVIPLWNELTLPLGVVIRAGCHGPTRPANLTTPCEVKLRVVG
jgi:hypothetical protein